MGYFYTPHDKEFSGLGGKAMGLYQLLQKGFLVPVFYVFPNDIILQVKNKALSYESIISEWIKETKPDINSLWAVRSSAAVEDGIEKSYAGQFTTVLNCKTNELAAAFKKIAENFATVSNSNYHTKQEIEGSIILQEMINGSLSGVGFSLNPLSHEDENPILSILNGMCNNIASGKENAMMLELLADGKVDVKSEEETFYGTNFIDGYSIRQAISKVDLYNAVQPFVSEIREKLKQLENDLCYPVDTEFTIFDSKIYWLQVRPISNYIRQENYIVWDNSNISANYPGVVLPLTSSFVQYAYENGYSEMFRFLGARKSFFEINRKRFKNAVGTIDGALYYNITAWQEMLWQMPFGKKTSAMLTKMIGANAAQFEKISKKSSFFIYCRFSLNLTRSILFFGYYKRNYLKKCQQAFATFNRAHLKDKTHEQLVEEFYVNEKMLTHYWFAPLLNGFFTMIAYNTLNKTLLRSRLQKKYPNLLLDVLSNSNNKVISVQIVHSFQKILTDIFENKEAYKMFLNQEPTHILEWLSQNEPQIHEKIHHHIECYGERCDEGELKMETVNYREDPLRFILLLKNNLKHFTPNQKEIHPLNYRQVIRKEYGFNLLKKWILLFGIKYTVKRVQDRENFRFIRTKSFHIVRQIFREIDDRLLKNGMIEQENDSLYLKLKELTLASEANKYISIIQERKALFDKYNTVLHANRYHEVNEKFSPVHDKASTNKIGLKGVGCSSGVVTANVIIIDENNVHTADVEGKVVAALYFEPGWIGLFAHSVGIISERGSLLSHTSILCRELNIPAIVGVKNLLNRIQNDELIQIDGTLGTIKKLTT